MAITILPTHLQRKILQAG